MKILCISGSSRSSSTNVSLLQCVPTLATDHTFSHCDLLRELPIFQEDRSSEDVPPEVIAFREAVRKCDAVIISTPEYIHNIPAILKNALEWVTSSGEFSQKRTLALTYLPNSPRGEKAMQSLLWSLTALEANIVTSLSLYHSDIKAVDGKVVGDEETIELLTEAILLLTQ